MAALTERNDISIAEICIYTPYLFIALYLSWRHGLGRNAGWFFLIMFSLIRITGASLELATRSQPLNIGLYTGAAILSVIGLSPLILVNLSLAGRALASILRGGGTNLVSPARGLWLVQLMVIVGLALGAVGGSQAGNRFADTGVYAVPGIAKAGLGLMIAGYGILLLLTVYVVGRISRAEKGEKRLALAVCLSLPFVLVRLVYASLSTFGHDAKFNQITGDVNVQLGMGVVMEMIAVAIVEGVGLTLQRKPESSLRDARIVGESNENEPKTDGYQMYGDERAPGRFTSRV